MDKMIQNYESRINKFVLKMAETPIIIKKNNDKFSTSREEFLAKTSNNILDKKGFIFKSYKTDRERINQMIKDKKDLDKYIPKNIKPKQKIKDWNENKLIQPSMRFTARCDLERVFDVLKQRELLFTEQKIVNDQMTKMGFSSHNIDEYDETDSDNSNTHKDNNYNIINEYKYLNEKEKEQKMRHNKIIQDRKAMIARRHLYLGINLDNKNKNKKDNKNNTGNHYAKQLREELYRKTHFKAMENLTMFKTSTMNHNLFKIWSKEDKKQQKHLKNNKKLFYYDLSQKFKNLLKESKDKNIRKYHSLNNKAIKNDLSENTDNDNDNENKIDETNIGWGENKKVFKDVEINKELMISNPLLYNLNFNSFKSEEKINEKLNKKKIKTLKKLAFESGNSNEVSSADYEGLEGDDLKREENIIIDGKHFKKTDTDLIADKLLSKCNWNEKRNKYQNKFGNGKLMFTGGLTLKEFETKYGILP